MPEPLHLGHGMDLRNRWTVLSFTCSIPFSQSGQIIFKLSLHEFRRFNAEFIKLGIQLLANFATPSYEELNGMPSIGIKTY